MNEAETRAEHIDPALKAAGWGVVFGSRLTASKIPGISRKAFREKCKRYGIPSACSDSNEEEGQRDEPMNAINYPLSIVH